ncbi:hypothetical protein [Halobacillus aidingensis]|uniref:Uncharacterized protein n=1 Tax=Halobacillus aidingensis TaxID=240303 RepID=A0A1H0J1E9_HALAD|nr:hypothetical protein [Halobacillus aidingensis]SDO37422.1 hypothetical protein SAMN05421677_104250 [Halobacillus aidingensis]
MRNLGRDEMLKRLEFFIGEWEIEVIHPQFKTSSIKGQTLFDWMEKEKFIVQRTFIKQMEFPSSTIVYDYDSNTSNYLQHYFDSRGVTRLYYMNLKSGLWELWRNSSDFFPIRFLPAFCWGNQ